tara:strand:+ start:2799 stop:3593 length:795 start_codon:yes stop_codon:yes gene_type:complete
MATLNLGRLKPVFRGSWNNATSYSVDDIVVRNNQSYISIQAGTNQDPATATAYWTLMAAAGTDVGATLTTQGDLLYRDGSGLQRLAKGTSGQVLKQGTNHPEWGTDIGGKIGQVLSSSVTSAQSTTSSSWTDMTGGFSIAITPASTASKILWSFHIAGNSSDQYTKVKIVYGDGSDLNTQAIGDAAGSRIRATIGGIYSSGSDTGVQYSMQGLDSPNTASSITYKLQWQIPGSNTTYVNRRSHDNDHSENDRSHSSITLMEVLA